MTEKVKINVPTTLIKAVQVYGEEALMIFDENVEYMAFQDSAFMKRLLRAARNLCENLESQGVQID